MQKSFAMAALLAASCGAQAATDADLAAIRAQIDEMKKSYEQRIASLEKKLVQAESKASAQPVAAPVVTTEGRQTAASTASGFNPEVSLILQGQYKNMKDVPERGITGFYPAGGHDHGDGAIPGISKRGFSVEHTELVLAANIDPYWRGQAIIAMVDGTAEVEEAWFQSLGLGHGIGLKGGRYRSGIGYLNEQHPHMWDFADAPLMYQAMFGEEASYVQDGVQFKWLAPTETFIELGVEAGRGATFPGTDRNKNGSGAAAAFAHVGGDVGLSSNWRAGVSYLKTKAKEREGHFEDIGGVEALGKFTGDSSTVLADFVWKWAPNGNPKYQNFKFQTEYFSRREKGDLTCSDDEGVGNACDPLVAGDSVTSRYKTRQSGWYAQGVFQFTPQWRAGLRYEQLDSGHRDFGANAANLVVADYRPKKATAMVDYSWSEFSRVRLQFAQDKSMLGITDNQVTLQYVMSLGAHGAHKF
ncbi:TonB-dependent receptor [Ferribacterium limneticum]|uniref:TonB-dependent receptor n=1 Tax=Ferribacterium limneticum TaxID=76259 RepID=UPI001CF99AF6|nr:TonB-dependent receptor [Ferribacterium limneticum]UCV28733.1 carbohydrate porin [Ferribacterium limneticum]UCV32650.1 carbohydrate porin [Ferribacterium limneticum]